MGLLRRVNTMTCTEHLTCGSGQGALVIVVITFTCGVIRVLVRSTRTLPWSPQPAASLFVRLFTAGTCALQMLRPSSRCDVIWRWGLTEGPGFPWVHGSGPHHGFSVPTRRDSNTRTDPPSVHRVRTQQESSLPQSRKSALLEPSPTGALISGFRPPELWEDQCLLLRRCILGHLVLAAQADQARGHAKPCQEHSLKGNRDRYMERHSSYFLLWCSFSSFIHSLSH